MSSLERVSRDRFLVEVTIALLVEDIVDDLMLIELELEVDEDDDEDIKNILSIVLLYSLFIVSSKVGVFFFSCCFSF